MKIACIPEQGVGDCIMYSRYLPLVAERSGEDAIVPCNPDLGALLATMPRTRISQEPCDRYVLLGSLPRIFGVVPPVPCDGIVWTKPSNNKPRIGVCWKGSSQHALDKDRSSAIDFRESLKDERWEIVSLQYGEDFKPQDYLETAELMRTLDAVVTVDTSVVHLAGTLGVPTILIPPASPEWRWGIGQETTPWYPSVRIVRRTHVDAWANAIQRAKRELVDVL